MGCWDILDQYIRVWQEDDCAPDAERIYEAWLRLYGEELDLRRALNTIDGGDSTAYVMPYGRVAITSYKGNAEIRQLK